MTDRQLQAEESYPTLPSLAIASDHAGYQQKCELAEWLMGLSYQVSDLGPFSEERVDYPEYAALVARVVSSGEADLGILICGTGLGMAIAANKIKGIRAATLTSVDFAVLAREHNAANVAALSARFVDLPTNQQIVAAFLSATPLGERHAHRVAMIDALDNRDGAILST